jgi:hypothetical protein
MQGQAAGMSLLLRGAACIWRRTTGHCARSDTGTFGNTAMKRQAQVGTVFLLNAVLSITPHQQVFCRACAMCCSVHFTCKMQNLLSLQTCYVTTVTCHSTLSAVFSLQGRARLCARHAATRRSAQPPRRTRSARWFAFNARWQGCCVAAAAAAAPHKAHHRPAAQRESVGRCCAGAGPVCACGTHR